MKNVSKCIVDAIQGFEGRLDAKGLKNQACMR